MPGLDHDREMLRLPPQRQRSAVHEDRDDGFSRCDQLFEHFSLSAGKRDVRFGGGFSGHGGRLANDRDDDVAVLAGRRQLFFIQISLRPAAGIIGDIRARVLKAVQNSDAVLFLPSHGPGAGHFVRRIRQCADQADPAALVKRQHIAVIFEKDNGLLRSLARERGMLRRYSLLIGLDHFFRHIGVLKQSQPHLDAQDPADRLVDDFHGNFSALHGRFQVVLVDMRSHIHVHSGDRRLCARIGVVRRDPVNNTFLDGVGVTHHKSLKSQLLLENVAEQILIDRAGDPVQVIECRHHSRGAFFHGRAESRQVDVVKLRCGHGRRVVISSALAGPIADIVLGAGRHIIPCVGGVPLQSPDLGAGKPASQIGILAGSLGYAPPAGVAGHIDHGSEIPADAVGPGFLCRHPGRLFKQRIVEGSRLRDRDGEHTAKAVNHIKSDDQGNAQPRLLDGDLLQFICFSRIVSHNGTHQSRPNLLLVEVLLGRRHEALKFLLGKSSVRQHLDEFRKGDIKSSHYGRRFLIHLPDLLFQGHLRQDRFHFRPLFIRKFHMRFTPLCLLQTIPLYFIL